MAINNSVTVRYCKKNIEALHYCKKYCNFSIL